MTIRKETLLMLAASLLIPASLQANSDYETKALDQQHCASCHGTDRLGGMGPALLPENLSRLKKPQAEDAIRQGRPATQMPAYADMLDAESIAALADYIYRPPANTPTWGRAEILDSHLLPHSHGTLPDEPVYEADMMNLFLVVEIGDHHVTVLDGDKMEPIHRFPSRYALHGGPKYSPDGRYVYFGSRDGWITKYDLYNLEVTAEVRAGINMRNIAVSADGKSVMAANYLPHTLVLFDADNLELMDIIPVENDAGDSSRVSAVYAAPPRDSF
ncbi:MAG TPA: cytochrome D1 domain-containing protein, partial [Thioalkalivibrio sp.]|nr:cytochrome D1 domain-containing protein [Thioalkalivibrio sp.]